MLPYVCKYRVIIGNVLSFCMFAEYRIFTDSRLSVLLNVIYVLKGRLRAECEPTSDSRVPLLINFWIHVTVFALLRKSKFILFSSSKLEWLWSEVVVTCNVLNCYLSITQKNPLLVIHPLDIELVQIFYSFKIYVENSCATVWTSAWRVTERHHNNLFQDNKCWPISANSLRFKTTFEINKQLHIIFKSGSMSSLRNCETALACLCDIFGVRKLWWLYKRRDLLQSSAELKRPNLEELQNN
jgi:hypothetical protein